jgi:hypothetical protein
MSCTICGAEEVSEYYRVGPKCMSRLGLRPLPPSRRPPAPCTRCNGMQFIRVLPRVFGLWGSVHTQGGGTSQVVAANLHSIGMPMTLTAKPPPVAKHLLGADTVQEPQPFDGLGTVETFICRGCGFVEWYCEDPEQIPIGPEYNSELVDYTSPSPYR